MNKVILLGNLGTDPESKEIGNDTTLTKFSLATSEKYKDRSGEWVEQTEWHNVELFGKVAEIAVKFLQKGSQVLIEGKIKTDKWEDKEGNTRYTTKVVGRELKMLGGGNRSNNSDNQQEPDYNSPTSDSRMLPEAKQVDNEPDSLPF